MKVFDIWCGAQRLSIYFPIQVKLSNQLTMNCFRGLFGGLFGSSNEYVVRKLTCVFEFSEFKKIFSDISHLYDTDWINR